MFTICVRFADGCMNLQDVKGVGLFCVGLDNRRGDGIIGDEKGTLQQAVSPGELKVSFWPYGPQKPSPCPVAVSAFGLDNAE